MMLQKTKAYKLAYWFLKTGKLDADEFPESARTTERNFLRHIFQSNNWKASITYWIQKFKENGMEFKLDNAEDRVNTILDDLQQRMTESTTADEYDKYALRYMDMMMVFGGNWTGLDNNIVAPSAMGQLDIVSRRELIPAKQIEEVEDAEVMDVESKQATG